MRGSMIVLTVVSAASLCGCRSDNTYRPPPPARVTVAPAAVRALPNVVETTGLIAGNEAIDIRPRIQGYLQRIRFTAGQWVEQGDVLFEIDSREYRARLAQAEAQVRAKQAELDYATTEAARQRELYEASAATQRDFERARDRKAEVKAGLDEARASVDQLKLDVEFCTIKAPFAGRMSRQTVDVGSFVSPSSESLATLVDDRHLRVNFTLTQAEVATLRHAIESMRRPGDTRPTREIAFSLPVKLALAGETGFPHSGLLDSIENQFDNSTGTVLVYARFDNAGGRLAPGLTGRVRLEVGATDGVVVPTVALGLDQVGRYVYVVGNDGRVARRNVEVGLESGKLRRIESGLAAGDVVVIDGLLRVRVGSRVAPERTTLEAAGFFEAPAPSSGSR